jgi:flagellar L-ring protein precursor FlgH
MRSETMSRYLRPVMIFAVMMLAPYTALSSSLVGKSGSLYTDIKAHAVGDILTVRIYEDAQASNVSQTNVKKEGKFDLKGGRGVGPLDFIPLFGVAGENTNEFKGSGTNTRRGNLKASMTVSVIAVKANGDLAIEGNRVIRINNDDETLTLSGIIRPTDINADNTVNSYSIADAQISYTGKGPGATGARPGIIIRFLNWLF